MKTIRSKLKLLTLGSMFSVFITVVIVSIYSFDKLSRKFELLLNEASLEQSQQMKEESERVKDRFLKLYESNARKKGETLLDKDAMVLKISYTSNSYSGVTDYIAKTFEFDKELALASFFVVEDGRARAWSYFSREYPKGLDLGAVYDPKRAAWKATVEGKAIWVGDPAMDSIGNIEQRRVQRSSMVQKNEAGKSVNVPVLEVVTPILDGTYATVAEYKQSGDPVAYLRYVISLDQLVRDLATEEANLKEKIQIQIALDQANAENVRLTMSGIRGQTISIMTLICLFIAGVAFMISRFFANKLIEPIEHLAIAAKEIAHGQYSRQVEVLSGDEVGKLAESFESMRVRVKEFTENLQELVTIRTAELQDALGAITTEKQKIQFILDNVEIGIVIIDQDMSIEKEYSAFTSKLFPDFQRKVEQEKFDSIFIQSSLASEQVKSLALQPLSMSLGMNSLNWEANECHLLQRVKYCVKERGEVTYDLQWSPIIDEEGTVQKVLLSIKDFTAQMALEEKARLEEAKMSALTSRLSELLHNPNKSSQVIIEAGKKLEEILDGAQLNLSRILLELHTLKGNFRTFSLRSLSEMVHELESRIKGQMNLGQMNEAWLKKELQVLRNEVDSFVQIVRNVLNFDDQRHRCRHLMAAMNNDFDNLIERFRSEGLSVQKIICRDAVIMWDSQGLEELVEIIRHALQNSLDHGFMRPIREQAWVPATVSFEVNAYVSNGLVHIDISDSGFGINYPKINQLLTRMGLPEEAVNQPTVLAKVLATEGFSTAVDLSSTSGRGVGMTAIYEYAMVRGGELHISPNPTAGLTLSIRVPQDKVIVAENKAAA